MSKIVVIGAAHLDIVGDYSEAAAHTVDKPGKILYSVGGTAYNIAANLAQNGNKVTFISILKSDSLITPVILSRLRSYNIDTEFVDVRDDAGESGFIAQRQDKRLVSAVTASTLDKLVFPHGLYNSAISEASAVVADCNCTAAFLDRLRGACLHHGKKLFVAAVSEPKAKRILNIDRGVGAAFPIFTASMHISEAIVLGYQPDVTIDSDYAANFCKSIGAEIALITNEENGYKALFSTGEHFSMPAPDVSAVVSPTGAGDALFAAFIHHYCERREVDIEGVHRTICRFVSEVLGREGATVGARTAPGELQVVPKKELDRLRAQQNQQLRSLLSQSVTILGMRFNVGNLLAFIGVVIALATFVFGLVLDFDKFLKVIGA